MMHAGFASSFAIALTTPLQTSIYVVEATLVLTNLEHLQLGQYLVNVWFAGWSMFGFYAVGLCNESK